ncbi:MAG: peptide chain release factor N(5)-glutamine methyltransferase [Candidatus Bipolaricaulota bacterium]|nr:peptide chain release factor N(5)-glutamine methyltransferase [Candidatus Bipolaricaulota bacterium]
MTLRQSVRWVTEALQKTSAGAARWEAELLVAHALNTERIELYASPDRLLSPAEQERLTELIERRCRGEPVQYLIGHVEFYNCRLEVTPHVLIPRPETEELVERIIRDFSHAPARVLDLGTGSGAIAIALARAWPASSFVATDISEEALALARSNALLNGVVERIRFVRADWFPALDEQFDLIVSNPPYVPTLYYLESAPRELHYEPRLALDGGESGLDALARIIRESPAYLRPHGALYLEIGSEHGASVRELLENTRAFEQIEVLQDLAGRDRFARAIKRERVCQH